MKPITIALIREDKRPIDRRVAFLPEQLNQIIADYPWVNFIVQQSDVRSVPDADYEEAGFPIVADVQEADILFGIKEVPVDKLIAGKTYLFFSHTIKQQSYNRKLLRAVLDKGIKLLDYEVFTDDKGARTVAFGQYAGIVGAYNGIRAWGMRTGSYAIRPGYVCEHLAVMKQEFKKVQLPPIRIAITGTGRVARGAQEILDMLGIKQVTVGEYLDTQVPLTEPVYVMLRSKDYHAAKDGSPWDSGRFHQHPEAFEGRFAPFSAVTDMLIACAFWHPKAPRLFEEQEMARPDFRIQVIADVTCDIDGSIPSTKRPSTIEDPFYDYDPKTGNLAPAFSAPHHISVMAVDNLPCELPRDASFDFGTQLMHAVLPSLLGHGDPAVLERATIAQDGKLTPAFSHLQDYAYGQELAV